MDGDVDDRLGAAAVIAGLLRDDHGARSLTLISRSKVSRSRRGRNRARRPGIVDEEVDRLGAGMAAARAAFGSARSPWIVRRPNSASRLSSPLLVGDRAMTSAPSAGEAVDDGLARCPFAEDPVIIRFLPLNSIRILPSGSRVTVSGAVTSAGLRRRRSGRNTVSSPIAGRNEQTLKTKSMLVASASHAEHRRADAAHAEGEAEEDARRPCRPGRAPAPARRPRWPRRPRP